MGEQQCSMSKPGRKSSFGPQSYNSKYSNSPAHSIGNAENHTSHPKEYISPEHEKTANYGRHSPGPAAPYGARSSLKDQVNSKKTTAPAHSFSTARRFKNNAIANSGSPGPGSYSI